MNQDPGVIEQARLNKEAEALPLPETLGAFVRERAETLGDQTAAVWFDEDIAMSYRELDNAADRLASSLTAHGVRKGAHVAVMLPNVPAFAITWFALGRIGAVLVPVNVAYTGAELGFVLNNSDAQTLIIDAEYLDTFRTMDDRPALLDDKRVIVHGKGPDGFADWQDLADNGDAPFETPTPVTASDLLNLQYTSGTTGFPKGCMLTHEYWMMLGMVAGFMRGGADQIRNVLIWAPFFYMDPMWQLLMAMQLGGTAYIARRMSLSKFMDWLEDYEIHYCAFPEPALKHYPPSPRDKQLKLAYVSVFAWRGQAHNEVEERFGVIARDTFGMTEIGAGTTVPWNAGHMTGKGSCGLPAPYRELKIVDDDGNTVAQGDVGELWVTGRAILWGYYKRPDANAENFRGRWFRTGDLARQDENGYYYIVGRIKEMIKRAGENISAREVEAVLRDMDQVDEAAVVPVPDPMRREEVKAYIILRPEVAREDCPPETVLAHCEGRLAKFKLPRYIAYTDDLPRTPTNKIAKQRLIRGVDDLRMDAFDAVDGVWR